MFSLTKAEPKTWPGLSLVLIVVDEELSLDKDFAGCASQVDSMTGLTDAIFVDTFTFLFILLLKLSDLALAPLAADFMSIFSTLLVDLIIVLGIILDLLLLNVEGRGTLR